MTGKTLYVFDMDGTLADRGSTDPYPEVADWFKGNHVALLRTGCHFAVATNQGGVGLREWMIRDGFGNPEILPDAVGVVVQANDLLGKLCGGNQLPLLLMAFNYQAKSGKWSHLFESDTMPESYNPFWRKPEPGMILRAWSYYNQIANIEHVIVVGDSEEDRISAERAGGYLRMPVKFTHRDDFFGGGLP